MTDWKTEMKLKKIVIFMVSAAVAASCLTAEAAQSTAYTYTVSVDGGWIRTQDAYINSRIYMKNEGLSGPQDLFISGDEMYIADTGNARIITENLKSGEIKRLEYGELQSPSGLFVSDDKTLYVADPAAQAVFIFSPDGRLIKKLSRPESVLFGSGSIYKPSKVAVSSQGNIYVVGEGAFEGIMQFDSDGVFQGYFAANTRELTALERIEQIILSEKQLNSLITKKPRPIQNICIDDRDLIYSVTQSGEGTSAEHQTLEKKTYNCIKRHNMAGTNILSTDTMMDDEWNFVDAAAGMYGNFFAVTYTGLIYEYDSSGNVIFSFGGRALENDTYGLLAVASAIDTDGDGILYVLDSERGIVQTFVPTDFATLNHKAIYYMNSGSYDKSEEVWRSVLNLNGMSRIAHTGLGRTLFRQQKYSEALGHFRFANDREGYSYCFWELRDAFITENMLFFVLGFILLSAAVLLIPKRKKESVSIGRQLLKRSKNGAAQFRGDMLFSRYMLAHPIDGCYYIKRGIRGSFFSATLLYAFSFIAFALDNMGRAFIFNTSSLKDSFFTVTALFVCAVALWNAGNYMVSTINAGEGSFKNIYIMTAYAVTPYTVFTLLKVGMGYILTNNEAFVLTLLSLTAVIWSAALIFTGLSEIHNYSFRETVKNIILTAIAMILAIVAVAVIYLIWTQLIGFLRDVGTEVTYLA